MTPSLTPTPSTTIFSNASFVYDGDGRRVKSVLTTNAGSTTTYFIGNHYEVVNGVVTKYYYAGSQRIAMRKNGTLSYLFGDHLGSTSLVTDSSGAVINQTKYKAWGETRYSSGSEQTKYGYTGQYSYVSDFGLHFYNARWYDPSLGRFAQADTIVPSGVQGLDRYAYVNNSPINYIDPSGHVPVDCYGTDYCGASNSNLLSNGKRGVAGLGKAGGGGNNNTCGICDLASSVNNTLQEIFGGHQYEVGPSPVCLPLPWINCTPSEIDTYLAGNQFPGQLPSEPVQSGGDYNVFPEQIGDTELIGAWFPESGAINVQIDGTTITNFAYPSHIFYTGYVNRTSYVGPLGITYVETYGAGYNDGFEVEGYTVPGWVIDQTNDLIGPYAFTALNVQLVLYTTWVETEQALNHAQQP